jgi:hypothetical protein
MVKMNPLVEAIDEAQAFVREHPEAMTREELRTFTDIADRVYCEA